MADDLSLIMVLNGPVIHAIYHAYLLLAESAILKKVNSNHILRVEMNNGHDPVAHSASVPPYSTKKQNKDKVVFCNAYGQVRALISS